jgi:hypothetical protein
VPDFADDGWPNDAVLDILRLLAYCPNQLKIINSDDRHEYASSTRTEASQGR